MSAYVAAVQDIYACFGRGDIPGILAHVAPDARWEHDATDHGIPWLKPGVGHDHVMKFFVELAAVDITVFDVRNLLVGGDQVAAVIWLEATVKATGGQFKDFEVHLWTFNGEGQVSAYRHLVDTVSMWKALHGK